MMLLKKNGLNILLLSVLSLLLLSCATKETTATAYSNENANQIYQQGKGAIADRNYSEAIKRFEALETQYPDDPRLENAELNLIYAYYQKEDYKESAEVAKRFISLYPGSPHVDYALYMQGLALYHQNLGVFEKLFTLDLATRDFTDMKEAYHSFYQLVIDYPKSIYAPSAYQYVIYLRNAMALHELQVAQYYYKRKAYVASAERASNVITHYDGTNSVKAALKLLADSYHQLGDTKLERETLRVIRYNQG